VDYAIKSFFFQLAGLLYFAVVKFVIDFYELKLINQQLIIEKNNSELNFLKSQTNPHFLFNTLNNIYLLCRDKSDLAPETVLRLSDILRYMLYETESDLVNIGKEIKVIEDYLALEKIRYDDTLRLNIHVESDNEKQEIPPLIMIPLIENAFKHGVSETLLDPFINISLSIQKETLLFTVENSTRLQETNIGIKENIGIRNLRRQLQLLFTEHKLTIEQRQKTFFASMFINLGSYAKG
jgi:LytS/YehU family sensor histidine kinase